MAGKDYIHSRTKVLASLQSCQKMFRFSKKIVAITHFGIDIFVCLAMKKTHKVSTKSQTGCDFRQNSKIMADKSIGIL